MNEPVLLVIYDASDNKWGLSTAGPNPPPEEYVPVKSEAEARRIKHAYDSGNITPFLNAAIGTKG